MQRLAQVFGWADFPQPLFHECEFTLRFELGGSHSAGPSRFLQAMDRARLIASFVFAGAESLTIIVPFYSHESKAKAPSGLRKALQSIDLSAALGATECIPLRDADDAEDTADSGCRFLFSFDIGNKPENISSLIWAAVADEMGVRPRFPSIACNYIADLERGIAMHVYDDRGIDLVATKSSLLRPCYEQFNGWLLDYDRERMAATFASDA